MRPSTEDLLNTFLWMAELAMAPTMANLIKASGQPVAYQQLHRLESGDILTRRKNESGRWVYRLTRRGEIAALGGRHPEQAWARPWHGYWTFLFFDIPSTAPATRKRLINWLRANRFGCLQDSVWITPDPAHLLSRRIAEDLGKPESALVIQGSPVKATMKKNTEIIRAAWDFEEINRRYQACLDLAAESRHLTPDPESHKAWRHREHQAWRDAIRIDPFLPNALLPRPYLGKKVWAHRKRMLKIDLHPATP